MNTTLQNIKSDLDISPCAAASKASMDCLNRNDYDRDSCLDYFQAYRDCKNTWVSVYCHGLHTEKLFSGLTTDEAEEAGQTSWPSLKFERLNA